MLVGKPGLDGTATAPSRSPCAPATPASRSSTRASGSRRRRSSLRRSRKDVDVVGLSILSGSHLETRPDGARRPEGKQARRRTRGRRRHHPDADAETLRSLGVAAVFTPKDYDATAIMARRCSTRCVPRAARRGWSGRARDASCHPPRSERPTSRRSGPALSSYPLTPLGWEQAAALGVQAQGPRRRRSAPRRSCARRETAAALGEALGLEPVTLPGIEGCVGVHGAAPTRTSARSDHRLRALVAARRPRPRLRGGGDRPTSSSG